MNMVWKEMHWLGVEGRFEVLDYALVFGAVRNRIWTVPSPSGGAQAPSAVAEMTRVSDIRMERIPRLGKRTHGFSEK